MPKKITCSHSGDQDSGHNYIEISMDPFLLNNFSNEDGICEFMDAHLCSEDLVKLKSELFNAIIEIINNELTDIQKDVMLKTFIEGKTQNEISKELKKHQTTIHKIIQGNIDYDNDKKRYGGAIKKVKRLCMSSDKIKDILFRMRMTIESG